eukprot:255101_1
MRGSEIFDASSITLNCGFVYERSCTLNANNSTNRLLCDTEHSCNSYVLDYSATDYILYEWSYWNYKHNITCNESKVNCEIYCVGSYSCGYNDGIHCPTNNMNAYCSIYGGLSSVRDSIIYAESIYSLELISGKGSTFSSSLLYVDVDEALLECGLSGGCSTMTLTVLSDSTNIEMHCPGSYSCQDVRINTSGPHTILNMHCDGYHSCDGLDVYTNDISMHCTGSYSCQNANIFASNEIEYNSLNCSVSSPASCSALTTYCAYPNLTKACSMEYQSTADKWNCTGDSCYYEPRIITPAPTNGSTSPTTT